jgi:hypothetical protein
VKNLANTQKHLDIDVGNKVQKDHNLFTTLQDNIQHEIQKTWRNNLLCLREQLNTRSFMEIFSSPGSEEGLYYRKARKGT